MGKVNIISNISSKTHAGSPFCKLDYKTNCKIKDDKIVFSIEGKHVLQIGYLYAENTEGGELINYEEDISPKEDEEWYLYKVPLLLDGKGKLKRISKTRFAVHSAIRKLLNSWVFLIIALLVLLILQGLI